MAEVIGALSASLHLTETVVKYCRSLKSASQDAETLGDEVAAVAQVLLALRESLQQPTHTISLQRTSTLFSAIQNCQAQLKGLEARLAPHVSGSKLKKLWRRATWPLQHQDTTEAVRTLHRYVQIFHFAATLDGLVALSLPMHDALGKLDSLRASLESGHRQSEATLQAVADAVRMLPEIELQINNLTQKVDVLVLDHDLCKLLASIPTLEFKDRHRNLQLTRMKGGSRWILEATAFVVWRNGRSSDRTLWCNGAPGAGKTYLASVVIDDLLEVSQVAERRVLYFYFDYKKQGVQTPFMVLQTLLHQLLSTYSSIPPEATKLAEDLAKGRGLPSWIDLMALFISFCNSRSSIFIVLDALDECDAAANRGPILELIQGLKSSKVQVLITSRPYPPDVNRVLGDCPQVLVEASDKDIEDYVLGQIDSDVEMKEMLDDSLKRVIVKRILEKSQGMFLLPALQINNILGQTNVDEVQHALDTLPSGLADNLAMTIERIKKQHSQSQTRSRLAFTVLQWLSTVRRPITTSELQHAIATRPGSSQFGALTDPKLFVHCCFGLTIIDKETSVIRLVHFSVNEFLQERRDELFDDPDSTLAASCLTYMTLFIEKESRAGDHLEWTNSPASVRVHQWPFWEYAARHWGIHAGRSCAGEAESSLRGFAFSRDSLKLWSEYMIYKLKDKSHRAESSEWERFASFVSQDTSLLHIASIYGLHRAVQECLTMGFEVNQRDGNGATAFMLAAGNGWDAILTLLLAARALDVNIRDQKGRTALCYAVENKHETMVRLLLGQPAVNVNAGRALEFACSYGWMSEDSEVMVPLLLSHADFNLQAQSHEMVIEAISGLARYMCFDLLRMLLRRPDFQIRKSTAEESAINDIYNYWLNTDYDLDLWAKKLDRMYEVPVVVALVEKTFDDFPDSLAPRVLWPFVYYAFAGYPSRTAGTDVYGVGFLDNSSGDLRRGLRNKLEVEGISFSSLDSKWRSFLHNVCMLGSYAVMKIDCVQFLLENGAEPNLRDETGRTPLHYAAASKEEVAPKIVRALISAGADPRASDNDGRTVLHSAASGKSLEVLELLVERGADINAITISGDSVLYVVAENAESPRPMIEYLLAKGCRLDVKNNNHMTPGFASFWRSPETLETFLDLGEDPFAQNSFGNSMFLNCVWMFEPKRTSLCLSHRPSEGDTPLHRVGYFGMNAFDFLSNFDRSVATELGFTTHDWLAYTPTPPTVRREHVLKFLLLRIVEMLAPDVDRRRFLSRRGAHQLLHLGDDHGATILLEKFLVPASRGSASPYFERTIHCSTCRSNDAPIFKCRICASVYFCGECRDVIPRKRGSYIESTHCKGHRFLEIPGENWRNLPDGKVNPEGQTMEEFLEGLKDRVMRELGSSACSGQGLLTKSDILEDSASY